MTADLRAGVTLAQALAMALPGAPPAAVAVLLDAAPLALVALALTDPTTAAAELLQTEAGRTIRRGLDQPPEAAMASPPPEPPLGLTGAARMTWAREHGLV